MMDKRGAAHHRSRFLFFPQIILMPQTSSRSAWTSRLGFILASAGSAVGLGAIWKFPYMAGTNGGSIFMLPTIAFSLTIGLALLIAEMSMGRAARGGAGTAYLKLGGRAWSVIGFISVATGALVLAFYSVVGGWCTHYFIESIMGRGITDDPAAMRSAFEAFAADPVQSVMGHVIFLTTTAGVVLCGVERGIERVGKILMPLLFILMLILIVRGLMLPGAIEGVKFLFMPDPEAFTGEALLNAMGFAFFSLSVGSGSMMNYGSYLSDKVNVGTSTAWIVVLAVMSSILGGLMIMPSVFAFGLDPSAGPGLTFITMPAVFAQLPFGQVFAVIFYLCIAVAAITSSVSMIEIVVAFLVDEHKMKRAGAAMLSTLALAVVGALPCLSFGKLSDVTFFGGKTIFDLFDFFTSNISLPVGGLIILWLAGVRCWPQIRENITRNTSLSEGAVKFLRLMMIGFSPVLVLVVLVSGLV